MNLPQPVKAVLNALSSLRLTVWLLAISILLVFFGTLDQVRIGIRAAQKIYFESLVAVWHYPASWPLGEVLQWIPVPLPGGYVVGPLLALNLVLAHWRHFRPRWRILGITLIHAGVLLLLVGQLVTNLKQQEYYMWLDEGQQANFIRSFHHDELYLAQPRTDGTQAVFSFPYERLKSGKEIETPFPFTVRLREVFVNAEIRPGAAQAGLPTEGVNRGIGAQFNLGVRAIPSFHSDDQRDVRTAIVEVLRADGASHGVWMVSNVFEDRFPEQEFDLDGQRYRLGLRFRKTFLPFTLKLLEFTHDRYPGTNIPSNFASQVQLIHPEAGVDKEVRIFMNYPLRYGGYTFFQASFAKQDTASMFQVVRNPGWLIPYIACTLVSLGLLYQFSWTGIKAMRRARS